MIRLSDLAARLGLTLKGDDAEVSGLNTLEQAGPQEISFLANPRYRDQLAQTRAAAVILRPEHADEVRRALISQNPYQDFGRALSLFARPQGSFSGISPQAHVDPEAVLGEGVTVYPFVYIGPRAEIGEGCVLFPGCYVGEDCRIGRGSLLYPNAVVMAGCVLGEGCVLQPGAVIGAEGFGFTRTPRGIEKIPQVGRVVLGRNVEIGANSAVDRAALDSTRIGDDSKIDNLVQIGHNVRLGRENLLVSQVGISGSTIVGDRCTMAGQAGVAGHLHIGDDVTLGPKTGVARDIPGKSVMGGSPAVPQSTFMRTLALMPRFPEIFKRLSRLERLLEEQMPEPQPRQKGDHA